jgi:hypothetical protein
LNPSGCMLFRDFRKIFGDFCVDNGFGKKALTDTLYRHAFLKYNIRVEKDYRDHNGKRIRAEFLFGLTRVVDDGEEEEEEQDNTTDK